MVVRSGQWLVHVVGISGQGMGKCKPGLWNSGSGVLGVKKGSGTLGYLQMERHTHPPDGKAEAQMAKGVHSFDIYGAQAVGQALGMLSCLHGADILARETDHKHNT